MKILYVQDTDWIRRNPIQHTHLAERLALRGHEIRVIDYEILWREEGKKELISKRQVFEVGRIFRDVRIKVIRPSILKVPILDYVSMLFTYHKEIKRQIREYKPDVIIGNDILTPLLSRGPARKNGIPFVFYAIDIEHRLVPFKFLQPLARIIESRNIRGADRVLSINEGLREYTINMGARREKTDVIRAGIDAENYDPGMKGDAARARFGLDNNDEVLFFMGWIYHFSGLKEVAIKLANAGYINLKLLVVGDGDAYEDLKKLRDEHGLGDRLILAGKQPFEEIPGLVAAADICILPAYNNDIMKDIVPIKMYEYMAMGKPVISTRLPGIVKEFGEGNGIIYVNSPDEVVTRSLDVLTNENFRDYGARARAFVEKLSWNSITDRFEKMLYGCYRHGS
jgi:glycosyltransferase involved in cell wall biosynthesis